MRKIKLNVVHCTAKRPNSNLTPEALTRIHKERGFSDCGYHYYIRRDGTVHQMRDVTKMGAHAKGYNANSIGVAYEGGLLLDGSAADTRTNEQKKALELTLLDLLKKYPGSRIVGHRHLSPDLNGNGVIEPNEYIKQCPCFNAEKEYKNLTKVSYV